MIKLNKNYTGALICGFICVVLLFVLDSGSNGFGEMFIELIGLLIAFTTGVWFLFQPQNAPASSVLASSNSITVSPFQKPLVLLSFLGYTVVAFLIIQEKFTKYWQDPSGFADVELALPVIALCTIWLLMTFQFLSWKLNIFRKYNLLRFVVLLILSFMLSSVIRDALLAIEFGKL